MNGTGVNGTGVNGGGEPGRRPVDRAVVAGYGVGVGLTFVASVGVFLQYGLTSLDSWAAGAVSFVAGAVLGAAWALARRVEPGARRR